ncbi:hypothetical protein [Pontibacter populi]|uniref:BioF2-like acetyltransferase domain-containing protein n=1 Tax=Pontibacter populi TaxID=890055 RepID=A0ABV1RV81_9BACT
MTYQYLYNQENLESICKDRPLITSERHEVNDFYGQAYVLKRYCGLSEYKSLKLVYEHSLKLHSEIWEEDLKAPFNTAFTSSRSRYKCFKKTNKFKFVFPIGPPLLYAKDIVEQRLKKKDLDISCERRGTIVFPSHSTHHISAEFDTLSFINSLLKFSEEFKPITICIYWKDYLQGKHLLYEQYGFKVISAGHIFDKYFLLRFYDICRQFKYSYANNIGSDLFYSSLCGCQYFCDYNIKIEHKNPNKFELHFDNSELLKNKNIAQKLFKFPSELTSEKVDFIETIAGTGYKRDKKTLLFLILSAEFIWKMRGIKARGKKYLYNLLK